MAINIEQSRLHYKENGVALIKYDDGPIHSYPYDSPWLDDQGFCHVYNQVRNHTLLDRVRLYMLYQACNQVSIVAGCVLEVGVWRGGSAALLASCLQDRAVYAADTFTGVVKSSSWEHYTDGRHADTSLDTCLSLYQSMSISNISVLQGIFPDDTGELVKDEQFSLVHIDVDVYESAKDVFEAVWPRVSTGGIVVFDDYGFVRACPGIRRLVDDIKLMGDAVVLPNLTGQAFVVKIDS